MSPLARKIAEKWCWADRIRLCSRFQGPLIVLVHIPNHVPTPPAARKKIRQKNVLPKKFCKKTGVGGVSWRSAHRDKKIDPYAVSAGTPPRNEKKYWEACKNDFLAKYNVPGQKNAATVLSAPKLTKYMTFEKIQKCSFLHWKCGFGPPPVGMTSTPGGDDLGPNTISSVGRRRKASIFRRRTFKNLLKKALNVARTLFCRRATFKII